MTSTTTTTLRSVAPTISDLEAAPEETIANPFAEAGLNLFGLKGEPKCAEEYAAILQDHAETNVINIADYQDGSREVLAGEPEYLPSLNDAEILGTEPEGFEEFLNREVTFLTGEMWGARDRRNTLDGDWDSSTMSWHKWIGGGAGSGNAPAWGFSRHPESKNKAGPCIVLGSSVDGARKAKAMTTMAAAGLDVDTGAKLDDVLETIEELGLLCIVYTSYNNGTCGLELKRDEVLRKLKITRDPTEGEIKQYLREFDKNRYEESFIASCAISAQKKQTTEGVKIILDTPPLEKFRLIFPLEAPVKLIDLAETQQASLDLWEDKITGLAQNVLGIHFDTSCTDPSRLFYTARHPKGSDNWYAAVVMGTPLRFDDVKPMKKSVYTSNREVSAFTIAGVEAEGDRQPQCHTPSGASLNEWHRTAKDRFMIADLLETLCPDKIRIAGGEAQGHVHTECPFEHEHSSEGGTATMAVNAEDSQSEYWTWFCHHDACQGRHKLQHLEEALRQGWFEEDTLSDMDAGFMLPAADGVDDPFEPVEIKKEREQEKRATFEERAMALDKDTTEPEISKLIGEAIKEKVDSTTKARLMDAIVAATVLGKREVSALWKKVGETLRSTASAGGDRPDGILVTEPAPDQTRYACEAIKRANEENPFFFEYMEDAAIVRKGRLRVTDHAMKRRQLGDVASFHRQTNEGETQHIYPPKDVVEDVFAGDLSEFLLPIRGAVDTPFFAADGALVTENGYHSGSEIYLQSELVMKRVSAVPTSQEVYEAKRLLIEEVLADFPLGALTRPEIVEQALHGEGIAAVTNMMALILLPFMREMIDGATPGNLLNKPAPGTGASLLVDAISIIAAGRATPALAMPGGNDEMGKTLTSVLSNGQNIVFFDNINHSVDSGELASAMTTPVYQARILGKSQTVEVDVRCAWVFTGNDVKFSPELIRRLIMIDLDAEMENPEKRTGFRHGNICGWASENRGDLVWACLTIIQNWVAQGMVKQTDTILASYENWSGVVGGVLEAAGMGGFMGNREMLKSANEEQDSPLNLLKERIIQFDVGTNFAVGDAKRFKNGVSIKAELEGFDDGDPLYINGWAYDKHSQTYNDTTTLSRQFGRFAETFRADRDGGTYFLEKGTKGGTKVWTLQFEKRRAA